MNDQYFMETALDLAAMGQGFTSPNPMVGAVVVKDGTVVGKGYHRFAGGPHAEVEALRDAGTSVNGATLYVTLEPCNHTGRTPPCTEKIIEGGIKRVVAAMADPNPDVKGGGMAYLESRGVSITSGVCEKRAKRLNEAFIKYVRRKRPFVIVKCATTLDGRIATKTGDAKWVSGEASRAYVHKLRHAVDAIMVGINTVKNDDPSLTTRLPGDLSGTNGRDPKRVILDTRLSISENAKVLRLSSDSGTIIVTGGSIPGDKKARIEDQGSSIIESALKNDKIDLDLLMDRLGDREITSLLIEGGGRVIASAFSAGIVDKVIFFFAPKILGGDDGVPVCSGQGPALMKDCIPVKDVRVQRFGDDVMVEGYIDKSSFKLKVS
ncbi:MAG: bifunctional diaminohydroxyphosphoribosylaminopyrimidine deaminase/5-amino-6-(5-phosphoribosylamino)uracil reductase RibD [Deltaproteobacteria bacterium]|nr:bifunctional diaminohydroxyphosphoribosylaminopyrimidine deaminase/5-amino-6-(5-phosphoribosylamino)uracil reductase RibD [Deltaproteobacteria bacterium]